MGKYFCVDSTNRQTASILTLASQGDLAIQFAEMIRLDHSAEPSGSGEIRRSDHKKVQCRLDVSSAS